MFLQQKFMVFCPWGGNCVFLHTWNASCCLSEDFLIVENELVFGRKSHHTSDLQDDLNVIYEWVAGRNVSLNREKWWTTCTIQLGLIHPLTYKDNCRNPIVAESALKNLGITVENNGEFEEHIQLKVIKAYHRGPSFYNLLPSSHRRF